MTSPPQQPNQRFPEHFEEDSIDIRQIIFKILGRWQLIVVCLVIALAAAYLINLRQVPTYQLNSTVILKDEGGSSSDMLFAELTQLNRKQNIENEIGILKSWMLVEKTIKELNFEVSYYREGRFRDAMIYDDAPFKVVYDTAHPQLQGQQIGVQFVDDQQLRLTIEAPAFSTYNYTTVTSQQHATAYELDTMINLDEWIKSEYFRFKIVQREGHRKLPTEPDYYFTFKNYTNLVLSHQRRLSVEPLNKEATILNLNLSGENKDKIVDFLNKHGELYIQYGLNDKNAQARNTIHFIDNELNTFQDSLQQAEGNFQEFRSENQVIDLGAESTSLIQKYQEFDQKLSEIDLQTQYLTYLNEYLQKNDEYTDIVSPAIVGMQDQTITSTVEQLRERSREASRFSNTMKRQNPQYQQLVEQIEYAKNQLKEAVSSALETNQITKRQLTNRIAQLEQELSSIPYSEQQFINLKRKFDLNDKLVNFLMEKRAETRIQLAANTPDHKILDIARNYGQGPIAPNKNRNYLVAFLLGMALPIGGIFVYDFFDNKIRYLPQISEKTSMPILGTVPDWKAASKLIDANQPTNALAEAFRRVRTNLEFVKKGVKNPIVAVTSHGPTEGKTFCTENLGIIYAMAGYKVLCIGGDLRKPRLGKDFHILNERQLVHYLIGRAEIDDIIARSPYENMDVIVAGDPPPNPAELLEGETFDTLLREVKERYDLVLVDTAPLGLVADAALIASCSDVLVYVVRQHVTSKQSLDSLDEFLSKQTLTHSAIIFNGADRKGTGYYGYGKGYYHEGHGRKPWWRRILS